MKIEVREGSDINAPYKGKRISLKDVDFVIMPNEVLIHNLSKKDLQDICIAIKPK